MLTGLPPFYTQNRNELFEKIKFGSLKIPNYLTENCKNLIEGLFQKSPEKRLGFLGAASIKEHQWFKNLNWELLLQKKLNPPFIPVIKSEMDVSNFDPVNYLL